MLKCLLILVVSSFCSVLYGQQLTGPQTVSKYTIAQKRLLVVSTASFINFITQDNLDRDSVMLMACKLTGLPFLTAYADESDSELLSIGAGLINAGKIYDATQLLKKSQGEERLQLSIQLAKWYLYKSGTRKTDLDSAKLFIQDASTLSTSTSNNNRQYICLNLLGEYYRQSGNKLESEKIFLQIVSSSQHEGIKKVTANAWHHLGRLHSEIDSLDLVYLNNSLETYKQLHLREKEVELLWEIADYHLKSDLNLFVNDMVRILEIQKSIGYKHSLYAQNLLSFGQLTQLKYLDAMDNANAAIENMKWSGISAIEGTFYNRLGTVYANLGKFDEALALYKKGLENRSQASHIFWFKSLLFATGQLDDDNRAEESLSLLKNVTSEFPPITPWEKAQVLSTIGDCYVMLNNYKLANKNFMLFLQVANEYPDLDRYGELSDTYIEIAKYYLANSNSKTARLFLKKVKSIKTMSVGVLGDKNLMLFKFDSVAGNYKSAMNHHIDYKLYDDSTKSIEQIKKFNEITIKYGAEKKDNDIKLLQKDKQLQGTMLLQAKYTRNWILGGVGLLLVIVGLLVYNSRLKQRTNKKLEGQRSEIEKQNITLHHMVDEKDWLVKEIHHRVKNNLQIVMSLLNSQSAYIENDAALTAIHDSQHRVQAMSLIHQKLYGAENVSTIDMSFYIRELVSYLSDSFNTGQRLRFELDIDPIELDVSQAVPLGLILNEAITNSIKYAFPGARSGVISISLSNTDYDHCLLIISDNGIGMPASTDSKKSGSLGMSLMTGLSEDLGGKFVIENNNGTTIKVSFVNDSISVGSTIPISASINS